uniref:GEX1-like protein n=1 Tax=Andalucia godoyi TaxID=505711 RepID=A0A0K0VKC7_ANDGO|nr:GEX1-like protein [Andalucia godoyi]|eukprot:ANDGO_03965.mRNA.1 hypothetical protein
MTFSQFVFALVLLSGICIASCQSQSSSVGSEESFSEALKSLFPSRVGSPRAYSEGQQELSSWEQKSTTKPCFKSVLRDMKLHCKDLLASEELKSKFAALVTNCEFSQVGYGFPQTQCVPDKMTAQECTRAFTFIDGGVQAYISIKNHLDNICFYVQAQLFSENTEFAVHKLVDASDLAHQRFVSLEQAMSGIGSQVESSISLQEDLSSAQSLLGVQIRLAAEEEATFRAALKTDLGMLANFSSQLESEMEEARFHHEKMAVAQDDLLRQQSRLANETVSQFYHLRTTMSHVFQMLDAVQMIQAAVKEEVESLHERHASLHSKMTESGTKQDIMSKLQQDMHLRQQNTLDALLKIHDATTTAIAQHETMLANQAVAEQSLERIQELHDKLSVHTQSLLAITGRLESQLEDVSEKNAEFVQDHARILTMLSDVAHWTRMIFAQLFSITSASFYVLSGASVFFLTATERTKTARLWLFLLFAMCFALERYLVTLTHADSAAAVSALSSQDFETSILLVRRGVVTLGIVVLLMSVLAYRDYNKENNVLLKRILQLQKGPLYVDNVE